MWKCRTGEPSFPILQTDVFPHTRWTKEHHVFMIVPESECHEIIDDRPVYGFLEREIELFHCFPEGKTCILQRCIISSGELALHLLPVEVVQDLHDAFVLGILQIIVNGVFNRVHSKRDQTFMHPFIRIHYMTSSYSDRSRFFTLVWKFSMFCSLIALKRLSKCSFLLDILPDPGRMSCSATI